MNSPFKSMLLVLALFVVLTPTIALSQLITLNTNLPPSAQAATNSSPGKNSSVTLDTSSLTSLQVSPEELYALQKLRIQTDLQDEIVK